MSKKLTQGEIEQLAAAYDRAIRDAVTKEEWNEIIRRNQEDQDNDATHDFVDGNHYACAAYAETFGEDPSLDDQNMIDIAAAVDYALRVFFIPR